MLLLNWFSFWILSWFSLCSIPYWRRCETQVLLCLPKSKETKAQFLLGKRRPAGRCGVAMGWTEVRWFSMNIRHGSGQTSGPSQSLLIWSWFFVPSPLSSGGPWWPPSSSLIHSNALLLHPSPNSPPCQAFILKSQGGIWDIRLLLDTLYPL